MYLTIKQCEEKYGAELVAALFEKCTDEAFAMYLLTQCYVGEYDDEMAYASADWLSCLADGEDADENTFCPSPQDYAKHRQQLFPSKSPQVFSFRFKNRSHIFWAVEYRLWQEEHMIPV